MLILFTSRMAQSIALIYFASQPLCREEGPHFARPVMKGDRHDYRIISFVSGGRIVHSSLAKVVCQGHENLRLTVSRPGGFQVASKRGWRTLSKKIAIPFKRFTHSKKMELSKGITRNCVN